MEAEYRKTVKDNTGEIEQLKSTIKGINSRIENLLEAIELNTMPAQIAGKRMNELYIQKEQLEKHLIKLEASEKFGFNREAMLTYVKTQQNVIAERTNPQKLIHQYIERVTLFKEEIKIDFKIKKTL